MPPVQKSIHNVNAGSGKISNIDAAIVLQHPMAFVEKAPPAFDMMQNAEVQHRVKAGVRKSTEIVRTAFDKTGIRQILLPGK